MNFETDVSDLAWILNPESWFFSRFRVACGLFITDLNSHVDFCEDAVEQYLLLKEVMYIFKYK